MSLPSKDQGCLAAVTNCYIFSFVNLAPLRFFRRGFFLEDVMPNRILKTLILTSLLFCQLVMGAFAGEVSRAFTINVYIPVMPGINAPFDAVEIRDSNFIGPEMIMTTEERTENNMKIIVQTIAPK